MPKGVAADQLSNSGTANNLSNQLTANASNIYGGLEPTLQAEAAHPSGYTPQQKALQNTAAQQSSGGSTAGAVGQGGLYAARTRNAGGAQGAIGSAVRSGGANLSRQAVGTETRSADLANQNQQKGIAGLGGLYGTELGGGETALGLSNSALAGADQSDANNPWMRLLLQGIQSGGQVAGSYLQGGYANGGGSGNDGGGG
jgi:hypothetical protein